MASGTTDKICAVAIELFNKNGYENVSLRNIAREASMAIGTLTYHFKTKEELLDRILTDLYYEMDSLLISDRDDADPLNRVLDLFIKIQQTTKEYPFYFRDLNAVLNVSTKQKQLDFEIQQRLFRFYCNAFAQLEQESAFAFDFSEDRQKRLAFMLVALENSWCLSSSPYTNARLPQYEFASSAAWLLGSQISDDFKDSFSALCESKGLFF